MNLEELKNKVETVSQKDIKLYFVTRAIKPGVSKSSKTRDKYLFIVYQIDCNQEIREYLHSATCNQINKTINKNYDIVDYDILSDDTEHLFTYPIKNRIFSFSDVVTNQLQKIAPKVTSISDLVARNEELWAYCVEFMCEEEKIYTFRKILPSKVGVDEKLKGSFKALFDTQSHQLSLLKEETVNLDEQIDCVFYDDTFYVLKKAYFEQIVGLQEEFKEKAKEIANEMMACGNFVGADKLNEMIEKKPSIHKKLIKVGKIGGYKDITPQKIKSMKKVCDKYGDCLPVSGNKFSLNSEEELDVILKAFGDYYKIGEISGKPYGTFAGKELTKTQ
jgi:hypothetical protein